MKTIWLIYPYGNLPGSGILETRQLRYGRALVKQGYRVIWWMSNYSHFSKNFLSEGWKKIKVDSYLYIELVPSTSYKKNISFERIISELNYAKNLNKAINSSEVKRPDLIITSGTGMSSAFWPIWPYMNKKNIPVVYDIMDITMFDTYIGNKSKALIPFGKIVSNVMKFRENNFYRHVSAICGLGKYQVEYAVQRTGRPSIPNCLLYNSRRVGNFRQEMQLDLPHEIIKKLPRKDKEELWCVYAGSLGPSYDIDGLIGASKIADERKARIKFIVAGMGPEEKRLKEAAATINNLFFLGKIDSDYLPGLYSKCDVGLCTYGPFSTVDMPDKFYDYTASGLAMVSSLKGESIEHTLKAHAGLQYQAGDSMDLYNKIIEIRNNLDVYKKNSYNLAMQFDFDLKLKDFIALIDECVHGAVKNYSRID